MELLGLRLQSYQYKSATAKDRFIFKSNLIDQQTDQRRNYALKTTLIHLKINQHHLFSENCTSHFHPFFLQYQLHSLIIYRLFINQLSNSSISRIYNIWFKYQNFIFQKKNKMKVEDTLMQQNSSNQEKIPQSKKYNNQKLDKQFQININLIAQTSLENTMTNALSADEKIQMVLQLKSIHLQWLNIKKIQNLEVFEKLSVLYLQHNNIKKIENLECLKNLQYLALNDNFITKVDNINHLTKLQGLNLNNNRIQDLDCKQLPINLHLVSFKNNPITLDANYKKDIIKRLRYLEVLDDVAITPQEKFKAIGLFPQQLMNYSAQMNQFHRKKQIKKQIPDDKPILLGGAIINEKEALNEMRDKTRKYLIENQEAFKVQIAEQNQDFSEKIKVSKNVRNIKEQEQNSRKERLQEIKLKKLEEIDREIGLIKQAVKQSFKKNNMQNIKQQESESKLTNQQTTNQIDD